MVQKRKRCYKNIIGDKVKQQPYAVKMLAPEQIDDARKLAIKVFSRFEAPEYSAKGIASFHSFLSDREKLCKMPFRGAFSNVLHIFIIKII